MTLVVVCDGAGTSLLHRQPRRVRSRPGTRSHGICGSSCSDRTTRQHHSVHRYPRSEPVCMTRPVSDAAGTHIRLTLLTAAPISRLRPARAQEGGTILFFGFLSQAKFRSAHLDPPEPIRPQKIEKEKLLFSDGRCLAPSRTTPAVTSFQKAISSFRPRQRSVLSELGHHRSVRADKTTGSYRRG